MAKKVMELAVNAKNPILDFNFEELKEKAVAMTQQYANIVVTEDSYKAAKKDAKELAGMANAIDKKRKEVKKQMEAPIKEFEAKCKELQAVFVETQKLIEKQTDIYDDKRREEKTAKATEYINKALADFGVREEYHALVVMKPEYSNLTGTWKAVKEDIDEQVRAARSVQDEADLKVQVKEKVIASLQGTIDGVNNTIEQKLTIDMFMNDIDTAFQAEGIIDAEEIKAEIGKKIISRGLEVKDAEDRIRQQAESEAARKIMENDNAAMQQYTQMTQEYSELQNMTVDEGFTSVVDENISFNDVEPEGTDIPYIAPAPAEYEGFAPADSTCIFGAVPDETEQVTESVQPAVVQQNQDEPSWHMTFSIEGKFSALRSAGEEIKAVCAKYGINYVGVDQTQSYKM